MSVSASASESLGPGLESSVSLEVSGRVGVGVGGKVELGAGSIDAQATTGATGSYNVTVPAAEYDRIRNGQAALPNPFDPASMPTGSSAVLNAEAFTRTELGGTFRNLAVQTAHQESAGTSIGVSKIDDDTVRVFAGPTEAVQNNLRVGVNAGPLSLGVGADRNLRESTTKTVDIDTSTPEGQRAYHDFLRSGTVPSSDLPGVSNSGTIEELSFGHQASAGAELNIGGARLGGFAELNSSEGHLKVTSYDDGRRVEERMARINDTSLHSRLEVDADGQQSAARTDILMDDVHPASASYLDQAFSGDQRSYDGSQDVQLTLDQGELGGLQERIGDYADRRGGLDMMSPPQRALFDGILSASTPDEAAAAFVRADSSGHASEALLSVYFDSHDEGPLPGRVQVAPDAVD